MKIVKRILRGKYKGYTVRQSKKGWYQLYNGNVSQGNIFESKEEVEQEIGQKLK